MVVIFPSFLVSGTQSVICIFQEMESEAFEIHGNVISQSNSFLSSNVAL